MKQYTYPIVGRNVQSQHCRHVSGLDRDNPRKTYCTGIAGVHFTDKGLEEVKESVQCVHNTT